MERDRNGDGRPDVWGVYTYPAQGPQRLEVTVDRNHDGRPDYWRLELNRTPAREWGDLDFDGRLDSWTFYAPGGRAKQWAFMDKNFDGRPDRWFHYGGDGTRPDAGAVDDNFDGTFERAFGAPPKDQDRPSAGELDPPWPPPTDGARPQGALQGPGPS